MLFLMMVIVPMSFFSPFSGLLAFIWASYFRPHEWAYTQTAPYSMAIAVATLAGYLIFELPRRAPRILPNVLILLLWLQLSLSTVLAQSRDAAMPKYLEFSKVLFMALLLTVMTLTEKRVRWLMFVTLGSIGLIILRANVSIIIYRGNVKVFGTGGTIADNNDFALLLSMVFPIIYYFAQTQSRFWLKAGFYTLSGMSVIASLFTFSRGGYLGLAAGMMVVIFKSRHRILGFGAILVIGLVTLALLPPAVINRITSIRAGTENDTAQQRLRAWSVARQIIRDHPFVGVGTRNILVVYRRYADPGESEFVAHNAYLQMATDAGLPALALFLGLIGISFWRLRKTRMILRVHAPDSPLIKYAHGIEAGLVAYLVSGMFASRQDLELLYTVIALATSFILMAREYEHEAGVREYVRQRAVPLSTNVAAARS